MPSSAGGPSQSNNHSNHGNHQGDNHHNQNEDHEFDNKAKFEKFMHDLLMDDNPNPPVAQAPV
jgi:hypothetical protein